MELKEIETDSEFVDTLIRWREEYKWNWALVRRRINAHFNTNYDVKMLKRLCRQFTERRK